jgi:uncharacterized membrane protein YcaP (DUF421 family)
LLVAQERVSFRRPVEDLLKILLAPGAEPKDLTIVQISVRGLIVFAATIWIVRLGEKRFLAQRTAYDAVLSFILASMLSRAINGSAPMIPTLVAGFVLILTHRLLAYCAARSHRFGSLIKGHDTMLIENGKTDEQALRKHHISHHDLDEDLRLEGLDSPENIKEARLERSGEISVIKRE